MGQERLTRQEISWLLAQEARFAAKSLRSDLLGIPQGPVPAPTITEASGVETTLDTLDDALSLFSALHTGPQGQRRGRIDLAALLVEVAPSARLAIAPGAGTEVYGVEAELRRFLHVLVNHTNTNATFSREAGPEVSIQRQGDWVRITTELGPDASPTAELERRWLNRMSIRHGGRMELEGGNLSALLPADGAADQSELAELKRELEQAQQLGEAYARELATVFPRADSEFPKSIQSELLPHQRELGLRIAVATERALCSIADGLRAGLKLVAPASLETAAANNSLLALWSLLDEFPRADAADAPESALRVDKLVEEVVSELRPLSAQLSIEVVVRSSGDSGLVSREPGLRFVLRSLLSQALNATPRGGRVSVAVAGAAGGPVRVTIEDGGPAVPRAMRDALAWGQAEPAALGRPGGLAHLLAQAGALALNASVAYAQSEAGLSIIELTLASGDDPRV